MVGGAVLFFDREGCVRMVLGSEAADRWSRTPLIRLWRLYYAPIEDEL